jgi:hypothetical protein
MEKYIDAWNVTSRTFVGRLQKESSAMGINAFGPAAGGAAGGKEMF